MVDSHVIYQEKIRLTFHVNQLSSRRFIWNVKVYKDFTLLRLNNICLNKAE